MPTVSAAAVSQLIDSIKFEARIKGADTANIEILSMINERLLQHSLNERYSEFLVRATVIALTNAVGTYDLPDDLANIKSVYFSRAAEMAQSPPITRGRVLNFKGEFIEESRDGTEPKYWELSAGQLTIFPYRAVLAVDHLEIDYWKLPTALTTADNIPVPKLFSVIKKEVIQRLYRLNKDYAADDRAGADAKRDNMAELTSEDNADNGSDS